MGEGRVVGRETARARPELAGGMSGDGAGGSPVTSGAASATVRTRGLEGCAYAGAWYLDGSPGTFAVSRAARTPPTSARSGSTMPAPARESASACGP
jgi:hypothetical protein